MIRLQQNESMQQQDDKWALFNGVFATRNAIFKDENKETVL